MSQHLPVVEMTRVSAEVRRDEAAINDNRDDRRREPFTVVTAADVDPAQVGRTWFRSDRRVRCGVSAALRHSLAQPRPAHLQGKARVIAGQESASGLFRVCASCGQLDTAAGRNNRYEHRTWCRLRDSPTEDVRDIALARTLRTQGVLLHLPPQMEYDNFAHPSLAAAIIARAAPGDRRVTGTPRRRHHQRRIVGTRPSGAADSRHGSGRHRLPGRILRPHQGFRGARGSTSILRNAPAATRTGSHATGACCRSRRHTSWTRCRRLTALKLLEDILDVGSHATPTWTTGPPRSPRRRRRRPRSATSHSWSATSMRRSSRG